MFVIINYFYTPLWVILHQNRDVWSLYFGFLILSLVLFMLLNGEPSKEKHVCVLEEENIVEGALPLSLFSP